jgi:MFS family permease
VTRPEIPATIWIAAAFDPVLILVAVVLGWRADQFGKVFVVAIVAFALSVLVAWLVTALGLPWVAPVARDLPTLYPVRAIAALLWAIGAFAARQVTRE